MRKRFLVLLRKHYRRYHDILFYVLALGVIVVSTWAALSITKTKNEQERADLALIIEEVLLQRCQGVKNEKGVWGTPAFPKLIYVLEEQNIHPDSPYYYLTKLAAKCTAKRMKAFGT